MAKTTSSNFIENDAFLNIIDLLIRLLTRLRSSSVLCTTLVIVTLNCSIALGYSARITDQSLVNIFYEKDIFIEMDKKQGQVGWDTARLSFKQNGNITGRLYSLNLLLVKSPINDIDNGMWEIRDDNLCIQWAVWEDGEEHCYSIYLSEDIYIAKSDSGLLMKGEFMPQY